MTEANMKNEWKRRMQGSPLGVMRFEPPSGGLPFVTEDQRQLAEWVTHQFIEVSGIQIPECDDYVKLDDDNYDMNPDPSEQSFMESLAKFAEAVTGMSKSIFYTAFYEIAVIRANEHSVPFDQYVELVNAAYSDTLDCVHGAVKGDFMLQ